MSSVFSAGRMIPRLVVAPEGAGAGAGAGVPGAVTSGGFTPGNGCEEGVCAGAAAAANSASAAAADTKLALPPSRESALSITCAS
jgi:hypothetical protein